VVRPHVVMPRSMLKESSGGHDVYAAIASFATLS